MTMLAFLAGGAFGISIGVCVTCMLSVSKCGDCWANAGYREMEGRLRGKQKR